MMINFERLSIPFVDYRPSRKVMYEKVTPKLIEITMKFGIEDLVGGHFRVVMVSKDDVILEVNDSNLGWADSNIGDSYYLYAPYFAIKE